MVENKDEKFKERIENSPRKRGQNKISREHVIQQQQPLSSTSSSQSYNRSRLNNSKELINKLSLSPRFNHDLHQPNDKEKKSISSSYTNDFLQQQQQLKDIEIQQQPSEECKTFKKRLSVVTSCDHHDIHHHDNDDQVNNNKLTQSDNNLPKIIPLPNNNNKQNNKQHNSYQEITIHDTLDLIITTQQHRLIRMFYRFLKHCIPETHHSKHYKYEDMKTYLFGYELIEWLIVAKDTIITRCDAMDLAEWISKLHIIIKAEIFDDEMNGVESNHHHHLHDHNELHQHHYHIQEEGGGVGGREGRDKVILPKKHLNFKDDSTKYSFIPETIIEDYYIYNQYLKSQFLKFRYFPNITNILGYLFKDAATMFDDHPTTMGNVVSLPPDTIRHKHHFRSLLHRHRDAVDPVESYFNYSPRPMGNGNANHAQQGLGLYNEWRSKFPANHYKRVRERVVKINGITYELDQNNEIGQHQILFTQPDSTAPLSGQSLNNFNADEDARCFDLISRCYHCVQLDLGEMDWSRYVPFLVFSVVLCVSGLALVWRAMNANFGTPALIYKILAGMAGGLWIGAFGLTMMGFIRHRDAKIGDIKDMSKIAFIATSSMSLFQISDLSTDFSTGLSKGLGWIAFSIQCFSFIMLIALVFVRWRRHIAIRLTPSYFFLGTGFIIGSATMHAHYGAFGWVLFGIGVIYCVIIYVAIIIGYALYGLLPPENIPSQTIYIAFPALTFVALVRILNSMPIIARIVYAFIYFDMLLCFGLWILMLRHLHRIRQGYFHLGWWAFCFPFLSFATATITYYKYTPFISCKVIAFILVSISNTIFLLLLSITIYHAIKRNLFIPSKFQIPV